MNKFAFIIFYFNNIIGEKNIYFSKLLLPHIINS